MKKRWIALLTCAAMLFAFAAFGCNNETSQTSTPPADNSGTPASEPSGGDDITVQGVTDTTILVGQHRRYHRFLRLCGRSLQRRIGGRAEGLQRCRRV